MKAARSLFVLRKVAVVLRFPRFVSLGCLVAFFLVLQGLDDRAISAQSASSPAQQSSKEARPGSLDVILLLDKSLSMESYFNKAKEYAAGQVIGPILIPGDRLIVELVYGKVERLIRIDITSEADKAKVIRAIREVKADGRFTDLGKGLDAAQRDLEELGQPERPKYVLMITDERQEAPPGSPYQSSDYKLRHPSLEYVKKLDLGEFRAITIGLQVRDKVSQTAPEVMKLLLEAPVNRSEAQNASSSGASAGSSAAARAAISAAPSWALWAALGLLALGLAGVLVALAFTRKNKKDKQPG